MGTQGLEPVYRWQSIPGAQHKVTRSPQLPSRTQGIFWVPTQGKGMWEAVMGNSWFPELASPHSCQSCPEEVFYRDMTQRCLRVSLAARCSIPVILESREQMSSCCWALLNLPDLPDKVPYHLALLSQSSKQLRGKKGPTLPMSSAPTSVGLYKCGFP